MPIDVEIDTELYIHRDSYFVHPTTMELEQTLDQDYELSQHASRDQGSAVDLDDDLGLD